MTFLSDGTLQLLNFIKFSYDSPQQADTSQQIIIVPNQFACKFRTTQDAWLMLSMIISRATGSYPFIEKASKLPKVNLFLFGQFFKNQLCRLIFDGPAHLNIEVIGIDFHGNGH